MLGRDIGAVSTAAYRSLAHVITAGHAELVLTPAARLVPMLNRIVGLGSDTPATERELDDALAAVPAGTTFYVSVEPSAQPPELAKWLRARALEPGRNWMRFARPTANAPAVETALRLERVETAADRASFARVVCGGFGLPRETADVLGLAPEVGWDCWLALDGDEPIAAGALFVTDGVGYLGIGATLAGHRGNGAQTALLAHRIGRAAELGCATAVTETGEIQDGLPNGSYRNILRAGFREVDLLTNWLGSR